MDIANPNDFPQVEVEADEAELSLQKQEKLQVFGATLAKQRDDWVRARATSGVDKRFKEDADQYHGRDAANKTASSMMETVEQGYSSGANNSARATRSTIFVGVTRQKVNAGEARLADIVLPNDDRNFGIDPTPDPELVRGMNDPRPALDPVSMQPVPDPATGKPMRVNEIAQAAKKAAGESAERMQNTIDDQLIECDFNSEVRRMLHDCALFGTGVMKGPVVVNRTRRSWSKMTDASGRTTRVLTIKDDLRPASFRVDPRNCFPDPACGDNIHNGRGMFEREVMTPKQVRDLAKQPGYLSDQLRKVLEGKPQNSAVFQDLRSPENKDVANDESYERWEYWGELNLEDLRAAGVEFGEQGDKASADDTLTSINGVIEFFGDIVVRAYLNPLEDGALPYDFLPWEKVNDSPWGYGIAHLMRAQQQVTNGAWRQLMDNAGISSGPQFIIKPGAVQPADKRWEISNRKIWFATDETADVRQAFTTVEFQSRQTELTNILGLAEKLADQETAVPMMEQGDQGGTPETVGGMQMRMNGANVVLRRLVKQFDDYFIKPHIRRYYDFNMAYAEDDTIKGDFDVNPRGSSALMIRDIQNQAFTNLLALATNPVFAPMLDPKRLFERALRAQHVDPVDIMRSDEEIAAAQKAAQQNQKPDPRVQASQVRAEADIKREEMRVQEGQATLAVKREIATMELSARERELMIEREIAMLRLAADQNVSLESIKAGLASVALQQRTKKELFAAEAQIKAQEGTGI